MGNCNPNSIIKMRFILTIAVGFFMINEQSLQKSPDEVKTDIEKSCKDSKGTLKWYGERLWKWANWCSVLAECQNQTSCTDTISALHQCNDSVIPTTIEWDIKHHVMCTEIPGTWSHIGDKQNDKKSGMCLETYTCPHSSNKSSCVSRHGVIYRRG